MHHIDRTGGRTGGRLGVLEEQDWTAVSRVSQSDMQQEESAGRDRREERARYSSG